MKRVGNRTRWGSAVGLATGFLAVLALAAGSVSRAQAESEPQAINWRDLIPPAASAPTKPALKSFLSARPANSSPTHTGTPEGRWLSPGSQAQVGAGSGPPAVVEALDGKRVKIGGYVVPLDFDATKVKEFLLVPFVGACIHVPPPPPNQILYVKSEQGFDVKGTFDPVWVTGKLATKVAFTGLAEAGYSLVAEKIEARAE
ncbi:MAG: DUF3299 domain-containing protein [Hyphomicrobiaceae bacterium]